MQFSLKSSLHSLFRGKQWVLFILLFTLFWGMNSYYRPIPLDRLERLVFDWNLTAGNGSGASDIILILAGEESLSSLGRWPWPRGYHAELIDRLRLADLVVMDILFPEKSDASQDDKLARAVKEHGRVVTAKHIVAAPLTHSYRIVQPFPALENAGIASGYTNMQADIDGMVRYFSPVKRIGSQVLLSFPLAALSAMTGQEPAVKAHPDGSMAVVIPPYTIPVDDQGRLWINFKGTEYLRYEYSDVLEGKIPPEVFSGKTVLIGVAASGVEDFFIVPTPQGSREITGVRLNAEILDMILQQRGIVRAPHGADAGFTIAFVLGGFLLGGWIAPRWSGLLLVTAITVQVLVTHYFFVFRGVWIAASAPVLGMVSAYFTVVLKQFVFSSRELAIRQYSLSSIHDLLVPRHQDDTYETWLETNWPRIAARTGIHLLDSRISLDEQEGKIPTDSEEPVHDPDSSGRQKLIMMENGNHRFRYQLCIPLPDRAENGQTEYTLLGWHKKVPDGRVQSIAAVVLASSWYFSLLAESQARKTMLINTIDAIAAAVDAKDSETGGHSRRVAEISMEIADHLGLSPEVQEDIFLGALIHDIGKIGIPDAVLTKKGRLTDEEMDVIRTHPEVGRNIMATVDLPVLTAQAIYQHHERCDGKGYPNKLAVDDITFASKIVAVADVFDAMTQKRYYKNEIPVGEVLDFMYKMKGSQFDELVINALIELRAPADWSPPVTEAEEPDRRSAVPARAEMKKSA